MTAKGGSLYAYVKKLYDLKEKNDGLSFEQIEGLQIVSPIDDSVYLKELRRMMQSNLPRSVVERTAKEFDSFRAEHGSVFKFSADSSDEEDLDKEYPKIDSTRESKISQLYVNSNDGRGDKMVYRDRSLYAYVKKLYDLREKNDSLSLDEIEGSQIVSQPENSVHLGELRRMMKTKLPRRVVERTAKKFDSFRARGPIFKFSADSSDEEDSDKQDRVINSIGESKSSSIDESR